MPALMPRPRVKSLPEKGWLNGEGAKRLPALNMVGAATMPAKAVTLGVSG